MGSCSRCHGRGQVQTGSAFGWGVCPNCSGTGQDPTGKPADWFFGDADKGGGKKKDGCGLWLMIVLALVTAIILGVSL